jgi:chromosome segregation ATPase
MNYRANQLRMQHRQNLAKLEQNWALERAQFQQDLLNLQNSTDAKIIENLEQDLKKKSDLLNQTISLLGASEIKTLTDLENLLEGKTLKELKESHSQELATKINSRNQEINKLVSQLDNTKERLKFHQDNLKTKEGIINDFKKEVAEKDQSLSALQKAQEKLAKSKDQLEEDLNHNLSLKEAKISTLETNLLNLAKQKLTNQKQSRALVEQIEKEWAQKQTEWQQQSQQQQEYAAQVLAQTKQEHSEEIRSIQSSLKDKEQEIKNLNQNLSQKETKIQELEQWSQGQHNRITELENQASVLELKLETNQRENQTSLQEQKTFYENQIQAKKQQNQAHQQTITQLNQQLTNHQTNINQLTTQNQRATETIRQNAQRITQLEERLQESQRDSQTKQTTITQLNQDKINLQTRITELTQAQTETTRALIRQRETFQQLLDFKESKFAPICNFTNFKTWLEADPARKGNYDNWDRALEIMSTSEEIFRKFLDGTYTMIGMNFAPHRQITQEWKKSEVDPIVGPGILQEITLIKEILSHE